MAGDCSRYGVCPSFVGLGRWPFRRAVNGPAPAKMRRESALSTLATRVPEGLPKGKGASSALGNLSQAVYGLAHRAPDDFETHPRYAGGYARAIFAPGVFV